MPRAGTTAYLTLAGLTIDGPSRMDAWMWKTPGRPGAFEHHEAMPRRAMRTKPLTPGEPLTRAQALRSGLSDADLVGGGYRQLFWGVYVSAEVPESLALRARAALMISPEGAVVSHHTAARLWGGVPPAGDAIHVSHTGKVRPQTRGVVGHSVRDLPPARTRAGVRVTSPEQAFLDLVGTAGLIESVVLGDSLVKAGATTPGKLVAAADSWAGRHAATARRAAGLVRSRVDSPMETRLRLLIVLAGLPEPRVNVEINDEEGWCQYRIDLAYPEIQVGIEFDGRHHIEREGQWSRDLLRREDLEGRGWRFVIVTSGDYYGRPQEVLSRVGAALRLAGLKVPARVPAEWRRTYLVRASA